MDLSSEMISPDVANTAPLTRREIAELLPEVPDWRFEDGRLCARFACREFSEALSLLCEIAAFAARERHLPDIGIRENRYVDVAWYTYAIGGLSRNDFIMAARLSKRFRSREGGGL
ncbi:4a-hydroxytetrahydrobiopterin dehydratase [Methanoculleus sp. DTU007]|jgi:4a-hydroxytetrahydrobiopterin dehydratase|uniref:4a-hydroxytetrahydrobiopterin dehydratase n=1 Tax=Methanoculleus TaxID=45989 RepID=UPI000AFF5872|nr:4a-hydroxytetrahydrobiopterin dehydratase [Methanoculleus sp. DTU007]NLN09034.1 4a-hydroxytetrahydrobiopterin dehydratase [Methanoculleus thermophilus]HQD27127.1 4a-hydroxytetrahydrobiopterin dehydratase [Methanoculleus thermophilus]